MVRFVLLTLAALTLVASAPTQTREQKVRDDRKKYEGDGHWIYNDLAKGFAEARKTGKPMLVVLRCIPCVECVKLDDELLSQDPVIRPLLEKFVCVRVISTNGLDLSLFQFDTDQSWAVFLLNADRTIYGRFGTRSHRTNWIGDVSLPGFARALQGALELHANYPSNRASLLAKQGPPPEVPAPEKYPFLKDKYGPALNYKGDVVKSCIHCHQIGDAQRAYYRARKEPVPETVLFPYPHPRTIGLTLDPKERATILSTAPGSPAEKAGLKAGDAIITLAGQPLLSIADVQWVLHITPPEGGKVSATVKRKGQTEALTLHLPAGWRRAGDLSWRSSSWGLRRMTTGGLLLEELPGEARLKLKLPAEAMALRVKHVGQFGPHAAARNAGFKVGDVLLEFDGRSDLKRDTDVFLHGVTARRPGDRVQVTVLREGKRLSLTLPMQE